MDSGIGNSKISGDSDEDFSSNLEHPSLGILDERSIKIDERFIIQDVKESNVEAKRICKILKIPSDFDFNKTLSTLADLKHEEYPNLFIFIIDVKNIGFYLPTKTQETDHSRKIKKIVKNVEELKNISNKFSLVRPIVLQLTSEDENVTNFFYKEENSTQFFDVDLNQKNYGKLINFSTFLHAFLNDKLQNLEELMLEKFKEIKNLSLILRFLRIFELSEEFWDKLILKCTENGSLSDLLAALDAPFEGGVKALNIEAQNYLSDVIYEELSSRETSSDSEQNESEDEAIKDDSSSILPIESNNIPLDANSNISSDQEDSLEETSDNEINLYPSVLLKAIENKNEAITDYLIGQCTHLIQQLSLNHQITVATAAFETNQIDVLCDLLEISDFPFPQNFKADSTEDDRLNFIISERTNLEDAIKAEDFARISNFIDNNLSLKAVYNIANKSALQQAVDSRKFKVFYHLKSLGFQGVCSLDKLSAEEQKEANKCKTQQRRSNVNQALSDHQVPVNLLCNRSLIHNRKITKAQESEYRRKIRKWFGDINEIEFGTDLLKVAASCEKLKIIFDFEDYSVENASLAGSNALGSMYPSSKWIFVGAKLSDDKRDQQIKGVLAHELCHYVMKLIFENNENPYYKYKLEVIKIFEEINKSIDKWSADDSECPDDECDEIISSVFQYYAIKDFHPELIVRVVQILAQFDDDEDMSAYLQEKYKKLFDYFRIHVWPEMQRFNLENREGVRKMNRLMELLPDIMNRKIEFVESKDISTIISNKVSIVTTNVPKLLFINIYNYLKEVHGDIFKAQNIFIDPEKLKNEEIFEDLEKLLTKNSHLDIFVDCSKGNCGNLEDIFINKNANFIFIVLNKNQSERITQIMEKIELNLSSMEINYNWSDLTGECQKLLIQNKPNFQNNSTFSFFDLLKIETNAKDPAISTSAKDNEEKILKNFSEIIDDQLLNLLLEDSPISINTKLESESNEKNFKFLFQPREFVQKQQDKDNQTHCRQKNSKISKTGKIIKISQNDLITQVKDKKNVLISDIAGSGKSWVIKNFTNILRQQHPTRWETYVDLKQFIAEFKSQKDEQEFSSFIAEKILKLDISYEAKIFKKMYEIGKVIILFDGFDEIAPDCAEFVSKLAKSFESNGGNQLWIATRDYFEVDLQEKLEGNVTFKLDEFTEKDGSDFIVRSWMLKDFEKNNELKSKDEFEIFIKSSPNFESYQQIARRIIKKIVMLESRSVGMPQLFKMIADSFKDNVDMTYKINKFMIYKGFAQNLYERWSSAKGEIRKKANTESQHYDLNFIKFHQFMAIKSLFRDLVDDLFPDCEECEWTDEEIIACGLMTKKGGNFYFLHETFSEFFVADYIYSNLKKKKIKNEFCELFARILTVKKFEVVRMFLNDVIEDYSSLEKILGKMQKHMNYFNEMKNFHHFFSKYNEHFAYFVIGVLKNGDYEMIREILINTAEFINDNTENSQLFSKYQDLLVDFLKVDDLKELIEQQQTFHKCIKSSRDIEVFKNFVEKIEIKISREFIQKGLKLRCEDTKEKIFSYLCRSSSFDANKVHKFIEIMQKFLRFSEIFEFMENCNKNEENILQIFIQSRSKESLQIVWTEVENYFLSQNLPQKFKEIVKKKDVKNKTILHFARMCSNVEYQETFLQLLTKTFEDRDELKDFLLEKEFNFIHDLVEKDEDPSIIELTFKMLKEYFTDAQFQEILKCKHKRDRNLLQMAGFKSKKLRTHQLLWEIYRTSFKDDQEFLDVIKEIDFFGNNVIQIAVYELSNEFFELMMNELEKIPKPDEIIKILSNVNKWNRNMLQSESKWTKSAELHENLWTKFRKYFKPEEILEFIKHVDKFGNNLLFNAVENNKKEFVELIWKDIKSFMTQDEQIEYLRLKNNDGKNLLQMSLENKEYFTEVHEWVESLMNEYGVQMETMARRKFMIEKYPVQRCCKKSKMKYKLSTIEEETKVSN